MFSIFMATTINQQERLSMRQFIITGLFSFFLFGCASIEMITIKTPKNVSETETPSASKGEFMQYKLNEGSALPGIELFSFAAGEAAWYTVDDVVMGGVSSSRVEIVEPNILFFSGSMSLENNGGFSSVRSKWNIVDLSGFDGVLLRVLGDGNVYRLRIRTEGTGGDVAYNGAFETTPDEWIHVYVPFANMVPTYRGFVMDVDQLDATSIGSFGFMLSDKQTGDFGLQVDWIHAVSEDELQAFSQ
jgi:monofunctional biosynthetic peptidoglycan transglycosylase